MTDSTRRMFVMLLTAVAGGGPPPGGDCDPYTKHPNTAADITLARPIVLVDHDAANITLCREIQP